MSLFRLEGDPCPQQVQLNASDGMDPCPFLRGHDYFQVLFEV